MAKQKTKTAAQSVSEYRAKTYARIEAIVPKDVAADFRSACAAAGTNPNRIINEWISAYVSAPTK